MAWKGLSSFTKDYPGGYVKDDEAYDNSGKRVGYVRGDGSIRINNDSQNDGQEYEKEDNDSGCYLTSACVNALNLPDDCDELTTLRAFRDGYMKRQPKGQSDIEHYYHTAPRIVKAINAFPDSKKRYEELYVNLVKPCVEMIKNGYMNYAYDLYKSTALRLEAEYLS